MRRSVGLTTSYIFPRESAPYFGFLVAYHDGQPFNDNMMRPCPMLENPEKLREIVEKSGARSTDMQSPETAEHLCSKCDSYAACWAPKAEELWEARKAQKVAQVGSKQ